MKLMRIFLYFLVLPFLFGKSPIDSFPKGTIHPEVTSMTTYTVWDNAAERTYADVTLDCKDAGIAHFTVSIPKKISPEGFPVYFIIAGRVTGRDSLELIPNQGNYALIAYEYSPLIKELSGENAFNHLIARRKAFLQIPAQVLSILKWSKKQSWAKRISPNIIGVSFGTFFVPPLFLLAKEEGISLGPSVLAYGGTDLYAVLLANFSGYGWLSYPMAFLGSRILHPLEPANYLSQMEGDFLIINGKYDTSIPKSSAKELEELLKTKADVTVYNLETGHIQPDDKRTILYIIDLSRDWLKKQQSKKIESKDLNINELK